MKMAADNTYHLISGFVAPHPGRDQQKANQAAEHRPRDPQFAESHRCTGNVKWRNE